jgi:hypothetical protein
MTKHTPYPQVELLELLAPYWDENGRVYRKFKQIIAAHAHGGERVETITSDGLETMNTAKAGDYIVFNQTEAGERYIVPGAKFEKRYQMVEQLDGARATYVSVARIRAICLTQSLLKELALGSPFYFLAPWGEEMVAKTGDYLAQPLDSKPEVYRIAEREFGETYEPVED